MKTNYFFIRKQFFFLCLLFCCIITTNAQVLNFDWAKKIGGTGNDQSESIAVDAAGNVYTTGWFRNTVDFDPGAGVFNLTSAGLNDIFVSKLDSSGNFLWAKRFGGSAFNDAGFSIAVDTSGNVYTTGGFNGKVDFNPGTAAADTFYLISMNWDAFICKLDASGNFVWAKQAASGGGGDDEGYSITTDVSGNVYVYGRFNFIGWCDGINISTGILDCIFISKLNSSGNFLWAKATGGNWIGNAVNHTIAVYNNLVYITGEFNGTSNFDPGGSGYNLTSSGNQDIFIACYSTSGSFLWARGMGGPSDDQGYSIASDASGNIYVTGSFIGTADFDPGIGVLNLTSSGSYDAFICKLDFFGNLIWARKIGGTGIDEIICIAIDSLGKIYTTGIFQSTTDFDPGAGTYTLTSGGNFDAFILQLDTAGNFSWAKKMGSVGIDLGYSIAFDASGNVYTTGSFNSTVDFDPGAGIFNLTSSGSYDVFVHKLTPFTVGVGINETDLENNMVVYPNPNSGDFTIKFDEGIKLFEDAKIEVYNGLGEKLHSEKILDADTLTINLNLPKGIYQLRIITEKGEANKKIIIQ